MLKWQKMIVLLTAVLLGFYGISFSTLVGPGFQPPFDLTKFWLTFLYFGLFICALISFRLREWARVGLIFLNLCACVTYLIFYVYAAKDFYLCNILVTGGTAFVFNHKDVKPFFQNRRPQSRKSVLIVDDDEGALKTVKNILLNEGYSVLTAASGERGLQVAKQQKPDVIILDVILPGIKGRTVCARLKADQDTKEIPVIFLTAKDSPDDVEAEKEAGAVTHITKPVHPRTLLAELRKVC